LFRAIAVVILGNSFGMELAQPFRYFPLRRVLLPSDGQNGTCSAVAGLSSSPCASSLGETESTVK
jgi:hypothetical protein